MIKITRDYKEPKAVEIEIVGRLSPNRHSTTDVYGSGGGNSNDAEQRQIRAEESGG